MAISDAITAANRAVAQAKAAAASDVAQAIDAANRAMAQAEVAATADIAQAITAATEAVATAEAAALADLAIAEASAVLGDTQAEAGYELTKNILEGTIELIPALLALETTAITEGLAAYTATLGAAAIAKQTLKARAQIAFQQANTTYRADLQKDLRSPTNVAEAFQTAQANVSAMLKAAENSMHKSPQSTR